MEDKQLPKNEFVREKIKDKPKNYKRIWIRFLTAAGCGIVFALTAVLVMLLMLPSLREELKENSLVLQQHSVLNKKFICIIHICSLLNNCHFLSFF